MRNEALAARRELESHRRFVTGVLATTPADKVVDGLGNREWVADVYLGPQEANPLNIIKNVLVASTARQTCSKVRQPVLLERSSQGKYTVIGRADTMPAGAMMPEGSVLEPTYHRIEYNLAELRTSFIADITYTKEAWGDKATWGEGDVFQDVRGFDAFGNQVIGSDVAPEDIPEMLSPTPVARTKTRHILISRKRWGGTEDPLVWGVDEWGAALHKIVEVDS